MATKERRNGTCTASVLSRDLNSVHPVGSYFGATR